MKPYVIRQGDHLSALAARMAFDADEVWNHERNADVRERGEPDILPPGAILYVPDSPPVRCALNPRTNNRFKANAPNVPVRVSVGAANEPYVVEGLGEPRHGQADGDGRIALEVPAHTREVVLHLPNQNHATVLQIGHLNPITTESGLRTRLEHLRYILPVAHRHPAEQNPTSAERREEVRGALARFQQEKRMDPTGELDEATRTALREAHGS